VTGDRMAAQFSLAAAEHGGGLDYLVCKAAERLPGVRRVATLTLILVLSLVATVPVAAIIPPDPLWLRGLYDGADSDDLVALSASQVGVNQLFQTFERWPATSGSQMPVIAPDAKAVYQATRPGRSPPPLGSQLS